MYLTYIENHPTLAWHVETKDNYKHQESFSLLTSKRFSWKIRTQLGHFETQNLQKKNTQPHQNFVVKIIRKLSFNTMLNLKTRFEKKRSVWNKWNVVYLGAMFSKVHTWIFVQLIFFQALSLIFVSCLPKSWWKMWHVS